MSPEQGTAATTALLGEPATGSDGDSPPALAARETEIPFEKGSNDSALTMVSNTETTAMDVPLHPGSERWYREHSKR